MQIINAQKIKLVDREINYEQYQKTDPNYPDIVRRIYASRKLLAGSRQQHSLTYLKHASLLTGIDKAVQLLLSCLKNQESICIVGDYDVDGASSTALMIGILRKLKANIDFYLPNRFIEGYGLSEKVIDGVLKKNPNCKLIITVDNGISSICGVKYAKKKNLKVIITDHHLTGKTLPEADAIINPNLKKNHPLKNLAGVGVCFYFMAYFLSYLAKYKIFTPPLPDIKDSLDLVALGTVADCVPLDYNNRILVLNGLVRIKEKKRIGLNAIIHNIKLLNFDTINSTDIAFYIAPCLNAAGRLEDMTIGVNCLLATDESKANHLALQLIEINKKRKDIQSSMQDNANLFLDQIKTDEYYSAYCFFNPHWHEGIIGILAGRLKDQLFKPVIAFAKAQDEEGNLLKGSARSISPFNIKDIIETIANQHPNLIQKYGGHAMAAGVQIIQDDFSYFEKVFRDCVNDFSYQLLGTKKINQHKLYTDGQLEAKLINVQSAKDLENAACWGSGIESPLYYDDFYLVHKIVIKDLHIKMTLNHYQSGQNFQAIGFFAADKIAQIGQLGQKIRVCYQMSVNKYNKTLDLIIRYLIINS